MNAMKRIRIYSLLGGVVLVSLSPLGLAQQSSDALKIGTEQAPAMRDGQHDFDFEVGSFNIHLKRLLHPLTGSTSWVEYDGTSVTREVWDGRAQLEEFESDTAPKLPATYERTDTPTIRSPIPTQWELR